MRDSQGAEPPARIEVRVYLSDLLEQRQSFIGSSDIEQPLAHSRQAAWFVGIEFDRPAATLLGKIERPPLEIDPPQIFVTLAVRLVELNSFHAEFERPIEQLGATSGVAERLEE